MTSFKSYLAEQANVAKRKYKVRFNLGKGAHFMFWRIENMETKEVSYFNPKEHSLAMVNAHLRNQKGGANKINAGETDKDVVAWVEAESVIVLNPSTLGPELYGSRLAYNPHVLPFWHRAATDDEKTGGNTAEVPAKTVRGADIPNAGELVVDVDKTSYSHVITDGSGIYTLQDAKADALLASIDSDKSKTLYEACMHFA